MEGTRFDEVEFFRAIERSGARTLLVGRRALIALGLPVLTADYDLWVHVDDIPALNEALKDLDLHPTLSPQEARAAGRYVLENDEHVDVLVARGVSTVDGIMVTFDDLWLRRLSLEVGRDARIAIPTIDDLILTKRFRRRAKDAEDIRLLEILREEEEKEEKR
jgi:hypothetical protein